MAQSAALAPRKEAPSLIPGSVSLPADVFLPHWERGLPTALDISVISSLQSQTLAGAATSPGYALHIGEGRKIAAHGHECQSAGILFKPLIVEVLGGWSTQAIKTIEGIGQSLGQRLGVPPSESIRHLFQQLAVALWRGNALLWIRRQPVCPATIDGQL